MLLAREISCSRSNVLVPVSAWSSPAESVSRSRYASAISAIVWSYSVLSSSRRSDSAARIFSVSAAERAARTGTAFAAAALAAAAFAALVGLAAFAGLAALVAAAFAGEAFVGAAFVGALDSVSVGTLAAV